ncbi:MAG: sialate O-acetylesterase [Planctomycetota bacterium]
MHGVSLWPSRSIVSALSLVAALVLVLGGARAQQSTAKDAVRVFVFAGQSNMEGADSKVADVDRFPPFAGAAEEQPDVRFWHVIGREEKSRSEGWVPLQPVRGMVGPELTFAREVAAQAGCKLAIIKVAAGGTTLGRDWNPDEPGGFEMYPLALKTVRDALADLTRRRVRWRLEGLCWHQGENDMFDEGFRDRYGDNLERFVACWRRDLEVPDLRVYIGELCTKTIWGMDQRPRMHAISLGQRQVTGADARARYVPTSHVGVEIGGGVGLHYHYGTLGQLQHGMGYAQAYLEDLGAWQPTVRGLRKWPYREGEVVDLYVMAGHRNMEGERAFVQNLGSVKGGRSLRKNRDDVAFRYVVGGGVHRSVGWEPLGPAGLYDTFGPELSFVHALGKPSGKRSGKNRGDAVAIAKFTHSGSQIVDWTPAGSVAKSRNLYAQWLEFVRESIASLEAKGHKVRLRAICYHVGENDASWTPHRRKAAGWLGELVAATRRDLKLPELLWLVSQQRPTDHKDVNEVDMVAAVRTLAAADEHMVHVEALDPPPQDKQLVFDAAAVVWLGKRLADAVLRADRAR